MPPLFAFAASPRWSDHQTVGSASTTEAGPCVETHVLGKYTASPAALHADGSLAAVWSDGTLFFFSGGEPASSTAMEGAPSGMVPFADNVVVWRDSNLRVVDRAGTTLWDVDFAKRLVAVEVVGDELICAAGALMVFSGQGDA